MSEALAILGGSPVLQPDHLQSWPPTDPGIIRALTRVISEDLLDYGSCSAARELEEEFALYQSQKYAIGTCSGTTALLGAYIAVVGAFPVIDPEIIVGGYGFWATATAAIHAGLRPVFCDVEEDTGNIDPKTIERAITKATIAIAVTHVDGHIADMDTINLLADRHGLMIVEDCSHAHGSILNGCKAGTFGDIAAFSLQTRKMLSGGEGGLITTDQEDLFRQAAMCVNVRRLDGRADLQYALTGLGLKLRISPLSATLALYHLRNLDHYISLRKERLDRLTELLRPTGVIPPITREGIGRGAYYEYPVRYPQELSCIVPKSVFLKALAAEGAQLPRSNTRAYYRLPIFAPFSSPKLEVADRLEEEIFFLPTFTFESLDVVDAYAAAVTKVVDQLPALKGLED